uniref:Uncharacterized protein n=1 Tax=Schistosoma haematobium TaxID=6185 RepID=A0A095A1C2_SCHHA
MEKLEEMNRRILKAYGVLKNYLSACHETNYGVNL